MADKASSKRKSFGRSASTESTEYSLSMGRSIRRRKPKERWLLTRKTWKYMTDAGRKLIPDGTKNCVEDIPKIEAHFQEICKKEPKFLLWRKNSYPGAISLRKKKKHASRKGGSCRKAVSEGEVDVLRPERPKDLILEPKVQGKFDLKKMREDFLNSPTATPTGGFKEIPSTSVSPDQDDLEENHLVSMLEQYLRLANTPDALRTGSGEFNYQELLKKLQTHLSLASSRTSSPTGRAPTDYSYTRGSNLSPHSNYHHQQHHVSFQGDHVQKSLSDTLSRYFGAYTNRDKVISDLLTDRKALEKLYFDLRKAKGFRGSRGGTGYSMGDYHSASRSYENGKNFNGHYRDSRHPPPLIEVESETMEITYKDRGTQTLPIAESVLADCESEFKKKQAEEEEEKKEKEKEHRFRRRSSVDNDDVSQSVSDTIKRYLRMARKKSVDADKAVGFKRVNYDRNLRFIKAKGEITKPGDDDGLNKGCQTNDDWILTYREHKMADVYDVSDDSRVSSARSSIDIGIFERDGVKSSPSSPPSGKSGSHGFLSHLLHGGKHDNKDKAVTATAMQKSKSSSSVMQQGSLVAKKIFRSRSKSQTRPAQTPCSWTNRGSCVWNSVTGRQVILQDTNLLHLTEVERQVLQKVAIAKLQALNLGVSVKVPTENVGVVPTKKRRSYLLKRKALTTGIFDTNRKDGDKDGNTTGGLVFGIPLTQCVENDRLRGVCRSDLSSPEERSNMKRHGSRASFSSLIDAPRGDETGSCESLMGRERIVGSVPGLLDRLSCSSTADLPSTMNEDETGAVPNILTECIRHLENHGLHTFGIFRVSASKKRLRQLREDFDCGKETTIDDSQCPHDVASLLKEYLRDLPDPLLCRDLYHAFIHTQRIRNRRLQLEALQHLVQLLPPANRDTLYSLLSFLADVAKHANDSTNSLGEELAGNKMDSNNLATVFAPNILHCIKPGSKDTQDRSEDRIDVINVVRILIDHYKQIFTVSAELLDEIYSHMVDSHPEVLDQLLNKKDALAGADESVDELDSESNSAPWTPTHPSSEISTEYAFEIRMHPGEPKKTYSREECLHESAATGGPNIGMRIRHKDKIRERSLRRKREKYEDGLLSRIRGSQKDEDFFKTRSSSIESTSSAHTEDVSRVLRMSDAELHQRRKSSPYILDNSGVLTASLTIPVQAGISYNIDDDIPYIEDVENGRQHMTIGVVKAPAVPRRRNTSVGSDSSIASNALPVTGSLSLCQGYDSAIGSSAPTTYSSPHQNTPTSVTSSIADQSHFSSPPSWTSSPPTSPDSVHTSVNYIPDEVNILKPAPKDRSAIRDGPMIQKVSFAQSPSPQTIQKVRDLKAMYATCSEITKSASATSFAESKGEREPRFTPSITSIGNAVLKSKTAEFERILKVDSKPKAQTQQTVSVTVSASVTNTASSDKEKKKYAKRRYTDTRHPTRHIPDSESLEAASNKSEPSVSSGPAAGPVYKRREIISSVHTK